METIGKTHGIQGALEMRAVLQGYRGSFRKALCRKAQRGKAEEALTLNPTPYTLNPKGQVSPGWME